MLKHVVGLTALVLISGCTPPEVSSWEYEHTEDKLRQQAVVTALTFSTEEGHNVSSVGLTVRKGTHDRDGVSFHSMTTQCGGYAPVSIRVDDDPIEDLVCSSTIGLLMKLPFDSPLAQRIMSSDRVVIEKNNGYGPPEQYTFITTGLKL